MRITKELRSAIKAYYVNREAQGTRKWDKEGDLEAIQQAGFAAGSTSFVAIAGTFWFSYKTKKHRVRLKFREETFPIYEREVEKL